MWKLINITNKAHDKTLIFAIGFHYAGLLLIFPKIIEDKFHGNEHKSISIAPFMLIIHKYKNVYFYTSKRHEFVLCHCLFVDSSKFFKILSSNQIK